MHHCCETSNPSRGPPEWIRRKIESRIARDQGTDCPFTSEHCCHPQMQCPPMWLRHIHQHNLSSSRNLDDTCERFSCFRNSEPSMLHHRPPFWMRNKCHLTKASIVNTDGNKGPPKSFIIEMLGLKRDYLNSKLNSLDSHIKKLKEEVKDKDNISEKDNISQKDNISEKE